MPAAQPIIGQTVANLDIAPLYLEGTRLQQEARAYEKYRFNSLKFHFVTAQGSSVSGEYGMMFDHDVMDPTPPATEPGIRRFLSSNDHCKDKIWSDRSFTVTLKGDKMAPLFNNESLGGDPRLVYQGQLYFFFIVPPQAGSGTNQIVLNSGIGSIEIEYDCTFYVPQLDDLDECLCSNSGNNTTASTIAVVQSPNTAVSGSTGTSVITSLMTQLAGGTAQVATTVPTKLQPSFTSGPVNGAQSLFLKEGNYLLDLLAQVASTPDGSLEFAMPYLVNASNGLLTPAVGVPVVNPAHTNAQVNNTPTVTEIFNSSAATTGQSACSTWAIKSPAGGAFLDGLYMLSGGADNIATLKSLIMNLIPISSKVFSSLVLTSSNNLQPKPLLSLKQKVVARPLSTEIKASSIPRPGINTDEEATFQDYSDKHQKFMERVRAQNIRLQLDA